jgi:hypothetical protein
MPAPARHPNTITLRVGDHPAFATAVGEFCGDFKAGTLLTGLISFPQGASR